MTVQGLKAEKGFVEVLLFKLRPKYYHVWKSTPSGTGPADSQASKPGPSRPATIEAKPTKDREVNAWGEYMNCYITFRDGILHEWRVPELDASMISSPPRETNK